MSKGISLHIGVNTVDPNHYDGWSGPLQACENDAKDMANIANSQGFSSTILLTEDATTGNVIRAISHASHELESGDMFFITFSGHGGQIQDQDAAFEEVDGLDETWCLYDAQLVDDQTYTLLSRFKPGVRIFSLSDSCHSGTALRQLLDFNKSIAVDNTPPMSVARTLPAGVEAVSEAAESSPEGVPEIVIPVLPYKVMPSEKVASTYHKNKEYYDSVLSERGLSLAEKTRDIQASAILISGCQDFQLSLDGPFNGMFTGAVRYAWQGGNFQGDYTQFHSVISNSIHPGYNQTPNFFTLGNVDDFSRQNVLEI